IGNFISYRIKKDAPLRMRTRAKSRVLPDGNRARRECAPRRTLFFVMRRAFSAEKAHKKLEVFVDIGK
ncbi:MAG TPA: hypothetical protein H9956_01365, partial [Candidatus Eisenbergiella pullicola]|nr:hypothetical protein [Candidatus Eisenbergiella pullicola]